MRGRRRVPKPPTRMRATFVLAESDQRWARWSRIPFMVIREVYLGYLKVFLAWQDQLLVAGSVFEGEEVVVGTSEGCESCGGVQDRWVVVLLNWQEEVGVVVVKVSRRAVRKGSGSFTRWWCLDRAALSIATRVLSSGSLPRVDQDTNRLHRESKPPVATQIDASRRARRDIATVFFLSCSCYYYGASEVSHLIHHDIHRNRRYCTLNIAGPSKLNIINTGPGRVYPPYSTTRAGAQPACP